MGGGEEALEFDRESPMEGVTLVLTLDDSGHYTFAKAS